MADEKKIMSTLSGYEIVDKAARADIETIKTDADNFVRFDKDQGLAESQQTQARNNIKAQERPDTYNIVIDKDDSGNWFVNKDRSEYIKAVSSDDDAEISDYTAAKWAYLNSNIQFKLQDVSVSPSTYTYSTARKKTQTGTERYTQITFETAARENTIITIWYDGAIQDKCDMTVEVVQVATKVDVETIFDDVGTIITEEETSDALVIKKTREGATRTVASFGSPYDKTLDDGTVVKGTKSSLVGQMVTLQAKKAVEGEDNTGTPDAGIQVHYDPQNDRGKIQAVAHTIQLKGNRVILSGQDDNGMLLCGGRPFYSSTGYSEDRDNLALQSELDATKTELKPKIVTFTYNRAAQTATVDATYEEILANQNNIRFTLYVSDDEVTLRSSSWLLSSIEDVIAVHFIFENITSYEIVIDNQNNIRCNVAQGDNQIIQDNLKEEKNARIAEDTRLKDLALDKAIIATFNITEVANAKIILQNLVVTSVDWGDGTVNTRLTHTYATIGEYTCVLYGVTNIGEGAFRNCSGLTSVVIGAGVTSIDSDAFVYCRSLTSVTIGNGVTSIGGGAFYNCSSLTSVEIGDGVTSIGVGAFGYCSGLTSVVIPDSVTSIGDGAFGYCSGLTSVEIPDSVTSIGSSAFENCRSLTSVTIGNGVTSIGGAEIFASTLIKELVFPSGLVDASGGLCYNMKYLTSVAFKNPMPITYNSNWFQESPNLSKIYVPHDSLEAYKAAWTEVADKIVAIAEMSDLENLLSNYPYNTKYWTKVREGEIIHVHLENSITPTTSKPADYIDWGDGSAIEKMTTSELKHTYSTAGYYLITTYRKNLPDQVAVSLGITPEYTILPFGLRVGCENLTSGRTIVVPETFQSLGGTPVSVVFSAFTLVMKCPYNDDLKDDEYDGQLDHDMTVYVPPEELEKYKAGWSHLLASGQCKILAMATNEDIEELAAIAKQYTDDKFNGANKAVSFDSYADLVKKLTADTSKAAYQWAVGQDVMVVETGVPDLWVSAINENFVEYTYTTDAAMVSALAADGKIFVGWYTLSMLETQKVDLSEYVKKTGHTKQTVLACLNDEGILGKLRYAVDNEGSTIAYRDSNGGLDVSDVDYTSRKKAVNADSFATLFNHYTSKYLKNHNYIDFPKNTIAPDQDWHTVAAAWGRASDPFTVVATTSWKDGSRTYTYKGFTRVSKQQRTIDTVSPTLATRYEIEVFINSIDKDVAAVAIKSGLITYGYKWLLNSPVLDMLRLTYCEGTWVSTLSQDIKTEIAQNANYMEIVEYSWLWNPAVGETTNTNMLNGNGAVNATPSYIRASDGTTAFYILGNAIELDTENTSDKAIDGIHFKAYLYSKEGIINE